MKFLLIAAIACAVLVTGCSTQQDENQRHYDRATRAGNAVVNDMEQGSVVATSNGCDRKEGVLSVGPSTTTVGPSVWFECTVELRNVASTWTLVAVTSGRSEAEARVADPLVTEEVFDRVSGKTLHLYEGSVGEAQEWCWSLFDEDSVKRLECERSQLHERFVVLNYLRTQFLPQ